MNLGPYSQEDLKKEGLTGGRIWATVQERDQLRAKVIDTQQQLSEECLRSASFLDAITEIEPFLPSIAVTHCVHDYDSVSQYEKAEEERVAIQRIRRILGKEK